MIAWIACVSSVCATAEQMAEPARSLPNASFESVDEKTGYPEHWSPVWGRPTRCAYSLATARTGIACTLITDTSKEESHGLRSAHVGIEPGATYTAAAHVKLAAAGGFAVYLEYWNATGQRIFDRSKGTADAPEWKLLSVTGKAPAEARSATVLIYCGSTSTGAAYFDDASLSRIEGDSG